MRVTGIWPSAECFTDRGSSSGCPRTVSLASGRRFRKRKRHGLCVPSMRVPAWPVRVPVLEFLVRRRADLLDLDRKMQRLASERMVQIEMLGAWILHAEGEVDKALQLAATAADREDGVDKNPGIKAESMPPDRPSTTPGNSCLLT